MPISRAQWIKYLASILLGNAIYFSVSSHLPPAARHGASSLNWGTAVDFWICLCAYGLLELGVSLRRRRHQPHQPRDS